jgi:predicted nucleic acid-binding protein
VGLIYLDACILIYLAEDVTRAPAITAAMDRLPEARFAISPLTKCECLVRPIKFENPVLGRRFQDLFDRFITLDIPEEVYLQAARLRARFGLKTPDALHLACAQHHRCDALWTNDNRLAAASHGLARNLVADLDPPVGFHESPATIIRKHGDAG